MLRTNTNLCVVLIFLFGLFSDLKSQSGIAHHYLEELPVTLSWDNDGVRITAKKLNTASGNLLEMTPFRYLEQIGNDLIRVALDTKNTPVVIDLTEYYERKVIVGDTATSQLKIKVYMPRTTLTNYNDPNSFVVELRNFTDKVSNAKQTILVKGLDLLHVGSDRCATSFANQNRVIVDVRKCSVRHLMMKGGNLYLDNLEEKIPNLCRKYNVKYFGEGKSDAFICLQDCTLDDSNSYKHLRHGRSLVTKYNITDFEDAPISYIGNMIFTKKGIGLNLKMQEQSKEKNKLKKNNKNLAFDPYDYYRFFPWYEFFNLSFTKYVDENQLLIKDPYNKSYIYNSKIHFTNVELIQFFNELKVMISTSGEVAKVAKN